MAMKSKKELKKIYREKYKDIYGKYPGAVFVASNGAGKAPRFAFKNGAYKITNQKGAFGNKRHSLEAVYETFSETNHKRHIRRREEREIKLTSTIERKKTIIEGAKGLMARALGE